MVQMAQVYKRPIWLTEFACGQAGTFAALAQVLKAHITMLDSQPMVARCASLHTTRPVKRGDQMFALPANLILIDSISCVQTGMTRS